MSDERHSMAPIADDPVYILFKQQKAKRCAEAVKKYHTRLRGKAATCLERVRASSKWDLLTVLLWIGCRDETWVARLRAFRNETGIPESTTPDGSRLFSTAHTRDETPAAVRALLLFPGGYPAAAFGEPVPSVAETNPDVTLRAALTEGHLKCRGFAPGAANATEIEAVSWPHYVLQGDRHGNFEGCARGPGGIIFRNLAFDKSSVKKVFPSDGPTDEQITARIVELRDGGIKKGPTVKKVREEFGLPRLRVNALHDQKFPINIPGRPPKTIKEDVK